MEWLQRSGQLIKLNCFFSNLLELHESYIGESDAAKLDLLEVVSFVSPIRLSAICRSMDESIGIYQTFWQLIEVVIVTVYTDYTIEGGWR